MGTSPFCRPLSWKVLSQYCSMYLEKIQKEAYTSKCKKANLSFRINIQISYLFILVICSNPCKATSNSWREGLRNEEEGKLLDLNIWLKINIYENSNILKIWIGEWVGRERRKECSKIYTVLKAHQISQWEQFFTKIYGNLTNGFWLPLGEVKTEFLSLYTSYFGMD